MKKWDIKQKITDEDISNPEKIITLLLSSRGIITQDQKDAFFHPKHPKDFTAFDVGIDKEELLIALERIQRAIEDKESIVVYGDYDADGITATTVMWEAIYALGGKIMPYIPHRIDEGYGLSKKGIDQVIAEHNPTLIITVDHGITGKEYVTYAQEHGIDVIVTDHHVKPKELPDTTIVHTTQLSGSGISWFVAKELIVLLKAPSAEIHNTEGLAVAAIGTIADMVPLLGANRSIAYFGISSINATHRPGLIAILEEAGSEIGNLSVYDISHVLAPRLNAMGRLVHAMDALRLLCTKNPAKAKELAQLLGVTNKERQQLTIDTVLHARSQYQHGSKKLIFISHESYNPGVIGLVAGKLMEEFYLPSIVVAKGDVYSKASARSIAGFNIVEGIRSVSELLVDVGGHPMAAGFTVLSKNLEALQAALEQLAEQSLTEELLQRKVTIDCEIPLAAVSVDLWKLLQQFAPFGFGNFEPIFASKHVEVRDVRLVGAEGKHLKLSVVDSESHDAFDVIAFGFGSISGSIGKGAVIDLAYTIDMNEWNGKKKLQLKAKDIRLP